MWKGVIEFGTVQVPVKLYAAVQDRDIHFRLLHGKDEVPVEQRMVNPDTGQVLASAEIVKAYEDDDALVILRGDELEALQPEATRDIEVLRFVDPQDITEQWFDRPYYLGPDGNATQYYTLAEALQRQDKLGVARWTMRNKEYAGALVSEGDHLMLITLRAADEVIPASKLEPPAGRQPDARELKLAEQLVGALESDFDAAEFKDEYRARVLEFVEQKAKGKAPTIRKLRPKRPSKRTLTSALEASLKAARKERKRA
jgi:DNA end-binding protein Ku